jgi:hypothetical protein
MNNKQQNNINKSTNSTDTLLHSSLHVTSKSLSTLALADPDKVTVTSTSTRDL